MSVEVEVSLNNQVDVDFQSKKEIEMTKSEPLKIPLSKAQINNMRIINVGSSISSINNSSSFGDSTIAKKTEKQLILNCDSPQMLFSLKDDYLVVDGELVDDADEINNKNKEKEKIDEKSEASKDSNEFKNEEKEASGSEMDSASAEDGDEGSSPFFSSDIDSDSSEAPPLLWNFADYFADLPGNDWCVRIPQCFIEDEFNLFELPDVFKCPLTLTDNVADVEKQFDEYTFDDLIDFITIEDLTGNSKKEMIKLNYLEDPIPKISKEILEDSILLYKLIHQRFIMTKSGLQAVWERFEQQKYGTCPRYYCHDQPLLPVGPSALPGVGTVKAYCLHCQDLYQPTQRAAKMDGVPFGPSFAHFFIRTLLYANETKASENRGGSHDWQVFIPKIYGFRIHREGEIRSRGIRNDRPEDFK